MHKKYKAFISYSHVDIKFARWLQKKIENYKIPKQLREKYPHLPLNLNRSVFRDEEELSTSSALPKNLTEALNESAFLIVVASPYAVNSKWVNREINYFNTQHNNGQVLTIIKEGEPYAQEGQLEAFPSALVENGAEPIASDARKFRGRKRALIKLIAGLLQVDFADLWEREKKESRKRKAWLFSSLALFSSIAIYASFQFHANVENEALIKIEKQIGEVEYELRHTTVVEERAIVLNETLKKLKEEKLNKEASLESLGRLESSIGKKATIVYQKQGAKEAINILLSKKNSIKREQRKKGLADESMTLARLYIETHDFKKAEASYEEASQIFFSFENIQEYAKFLRKQREPKKAIVLYERLKNQNLILSEKMRILTNLALSYDDNNQLQKSEKTYLSVLKLYAKNPNLLPEGFALALDNMGNLYKKTNRIEDAILHYEKALKIIENSKESSFTAYKRDQYTILNDLANAYKEINEVQKAEKYYEKALALSRALTKEDSLKYRGDLSLILFNLSSMYYVNQKFDMSKSIFEESFTLTKQLAKENPAMYKESLVHRLSFLSAYYFSNSEIKKSEEALTEALKLSEILFKRDSNLYSKLFSQQLFQKGSRSIFQEKIKVAFSFFKKSLSVIEVLKHSNPDGYQEQSASVYLMMASIYASPLSFNLKKAEESRLKALEFYTLLAKKHPEKFKKSLADVLVELADFYLRQNQTDKAENHYLKSVKIYRELVSKNPNQYNKELVEVLKYLAGFYKNVKAFKKSEATYAEALTRQREVVKKRPKFHDRVQLSMTLWEFSQLYLWNLQENVKSEKLMLESIVLAEGLIKENPSPLYIEIFSSHVNTLGASYIATKQWDKAENILLKSLKKNKEWVKLEGKRYNSMLAKNFNQLASLYSQTKHLKKAKEYYVNALALSTEESKAEIFGKLAKLEENEKNIEEAEKFYLKALAIRRTLIKVVNPKHLDFTGTSLEFQKVSLSYLLIDLSKLYLKKGSEKKAKEYHFEGLELQRSVLQKGILYYHVSYALIVLTGVEKFGLPLSYLVDAKSRLEEFRGKIGVDKVLRLLDDFRVTDIE